MRTTRATPSLDAPTASSSTGRPFQSDRARALDREEDDATTRPMNEAVEDETPETLEPLAETSSKRRRARRASSLSGREDERDDGGRAWDDIGDVGGGDVVSSGA